MLADLLVLSILLLLGIGLHSVYLRPWLQRKEESRMEDVLKRILVSRYSGRFVTPASLAGFLGLPTSRVFKLLTRMEKMGLVRSSEERVYLEKTGEERAVHVLRAHRLWERYLLDEARMEIRDLHKFAEKAEHRLSREEVDALDAHLGHPPSDPHGDPIPAADGSIDAREQKTLTDWPDGEAARIVHVEDEPVGVFSKILALGLHPGKEITVRDRGPGDLSVEVDNRAVSIPSVVAGNIHVAGIDEQEQRDEGVIRLSGLPDGEEAVVLGIDTALQGLGRRRLLDLGFTSGARVSAELNNFFGDPRAFRVRGALIALRREQADRITVRPEESHVE